MARPLVATIDIAAMRHNLRIAKQAAPRSKTWAIVKANAYGHGLERAMRGFAEADGFGLIEPEAAVFLRGAGWRKPILLLEGCFDEADLALAQQHALDIVVHCDEQLAMLENAANGMPVRVHLKMNSGMNRLGFTPDAFRAAYARLKTFSAVREIILMMHFANADDPGNPALPFASQRQRFLDGIAGLDGAISMANSATTLLHKDGAGDWVRPGIMLYGATPGMKTAAEFGLRPAMTLSSEIIGIQRVNAGDAVGYASRFVADRALTIGVVACGYADGYPRHAPDGTPVIVDGVRTRLIGRVSMDMLTVDLTPVAAARIGSEVLLWGGGLPVDEVAAAAGTIGYELMCAVAPRVRVAEIGS